MAYETAGIALLVIVIIVAIIVIILLIYYSCVVYDDDEDNDNDNDDLGDVQDDVQYNRQTRRNNVKTKASEIDYPGVVRKNRKKKDDLAGLNFIEDEIARLLRKPGDNSYGGNLLLDDTPKLGLDGKCGCPSKPKCDPPPKPKVCDKVDCQEVSDDVSIRGKSVYDFMTKVKRPGVMRILRKETIPNDIENGKFIQFEGYLNTMTELPENPGEGLQLNFYNNSSSKQTINSKKPILNKRSFSLTRDINIGKTLMIVYNGTEWIPVYQNDSTETETEPVTTTDEVTTSETVSGVESSQDSTAQQTSSNQRIPYSQTISNKTIQQPANRRSSSTNNSKIVSRQNRYSTTVTEGISSIDEQLKNILENGNV